MGSEITANAAKHSVARPMAQEDAALLEVRGLTKSFAGVRVLSSVDLAVRAGEVHALIGQNGSGKSTLIKIVSGYHAPDSGQMLMRGEPIALPIKPGDAARLGLRFLHQDVGVVRTLTVLENLRVGRYRATRFGRLNWRAERRTAQRILSRGWPQRRPGCGGARRARGGARSDRLRASNPGHGS